MRFSKFFVGIGFLMGFFVKISHRGEVDFVLLKFSLTLITIGFLLSALNLVCYREK